MAATTSWPGPATTSPRSFARTATQVARETCVRGRKGIIETDHGVFIFPDTHAAGEGAQPQHVYSVRFQARELWGTDASPNDHVYVDLWEDYLERLERGTEP